MMIPWWDDSQTTIELELEKYWHNMTFVLFHCHESRKDEIDKLSKIGAETTFDNYLWLGLARMIYPLLG